MQPVDSGQLATPSANRAPLELEPPTTEPMQVRSADTHVTVASATSGEKGPTVSALLPHL